MPNPSRKYCKFILDANYDVGIFMQAEVNYISYALSPSMKPF